LRNQSRSAKNAGLPSAAGGTEHDLYSGLIFLVTFASIAIGGALGMLVRVRLPENVLADSKEVVRLGAGLMGTVAALVLGLMIASAKNSFDTQTSNVRQLTANLILLDELLEQYGPETKEARGMIRIAAAISVQRIWRENAVENAPTTFAPSIAAEQFFYAIEQLSPKTDLQRSIKPRILEVSADLARTRLLMFVHIDNPLPLPLLIIMIFWLTVIFSSFTLFVRPNVFVAMASLVYALSVSSALFLIVDMSQPFSGLMKISSDSLRHVLPPLGS
jgi:hypothetical protein